MDEIIKYFENAGKGNRNELIKVIERVVSEENFNFLVIPTSTGKNIDEIIKSELHKKITIIAVILHSGFKGQDGNKISVDKINGIQNQGISVFQGSHSLSGVERSISRKFGGVNPVELIAATLKLFGGDGIKVAVEIAIMAADAGLIPTTENVLVAGGTSGGLDTLVSLKPAHMNNFFDLNISKVFAKPLSREIL